MSGKLRKIAGRKIYLAEGDRGRRFCIGPMTAVKFNKGAYDYS